MWGHVVWLDLSCLLLRGRQRGRLARGGGGGVLSAAPRGRPARPPSRELSGLLRSISPGAGGGSGRCAGQGGAAALRASPGNLALLPASGFFRNVRSLSFSRGKLPGGFAISCNHCIEALDSLVAPSAVLSEGAAPRLPPAPGGRVGGPGAAPRAAQRPSW